MTQSEQCGPQSGRSRTLLSGVAKRCLRFTTVLARCARSALPGGNPFDPRGLGSMQDSLDESDKQALHCFSRISQRKIAGRDDGASEVDRWLDRLGLAKVVARHVGKIALW